MPSFCPTKPSCSVVVALTDMFSLSVRSTCASVSIMCGMYGLRRGCCAHTVASIFPTM